MLNEKFIARMKNLLGEDGFKAYENELSKECRRALRINPFKKPNSTIFTINTIILGMTIKESGIIR